MLAEIDKDFYCSCDLMQMGNYEPEHCHGKTNGYCEGCSARHRKYPTPEQYKEEYGENWKDDDSVYCYTFDGADYTWVTGNYRWAKEYHEQELIVCACTPFGKPPQDWRPE